MCTHEFDAYTGGDVVLSDDDRKMVATLVDMSAAIQGEYSNCTDEKIKEKLAMERHTTRRSFDQLVFCSSGDTKEWKTAVERGLVISLAKVQRLRGPTRSSSFRILKTHRCFKSRSPITQR